MEHTAAVWLAMTSLDILVNSASARPFELCNRPLHSANGKSVNPYVDGNVTSLNLSNCNITRIDSDSFEDIRDFTVLYLNDNNIQHIAPGAFDPLPHLEHLHLQDCNLLGRQLHPDLFYNNLRLATMRLSGNDMRKTPEGLLQGRTLKELHLQSCSLEDMPEFVMRTSLPDLKRLRLNDNHISRIRDPKTFENSIQLEILHFCCNRMDYLHEDIFNNLTMLSQVFLHKNKLEHLPEKLFQNKMELFKLFLSDNLLQTIPVDAFRGSALQELYLNGNRLTFLPDNLITNMHSGGLKVLSIKFNPWQCGCLNEILKMTRSLDISIVSNYDGRDIVWVMKHFECDKSEDYRQMYYAAAVKTKEHKVGYYIQFLKESF